MSLKSGVIDETNKIIELDSENIINFLKNKINDLSEDEKKSFEIYKEQQLIISDEVYIEYFVKFKNYIIIYNNQVYFNSELEDNIINKVDYVKNGFSLAKQTKMIYVNGKNKKYTSETAQLIEKIGFEHSNSEENDLSFWYPKIYNLGFNTPRTIITNFTDEEVSLIKTGKWESLNEDKIIERIITENHQNNPIDLDNEMFIRLGISSNKFNFDSCHINNISELYNKLMIVLDDMVFRLEWEEKINLVLREFIKTSYSRKTIYNGMPLNTEFRVFYDFDTDTILGIYNYWDTDTMLGNLKDRNDLLNFVYNTNDIEKDFNELKPILTKDILLKIPNANLIGKWSIDFLYDGNDFVLIDMAHAECSYYYEKVLSKNLRNKSM